MLEQWLSRTRTSYDIDATGYAAKMRGLPDGSPYLRAGPAVFARSVRDTGDGPVADVGCGPGYATRYLQDLRIDVFGIDLSAAMVVIARPEPSEVAAWLREVGSTIEAELVLRPDEDAPGALAFARSRG